nr:taste receptor type 1 member 1-like [Pogona vitticeps]
MSAAWVVAAALLLVSPGRGAHTSCPSLFHLPGDLMIEGLFPVHSNSTGRNRSMGQLPVCRGLNSWGYSQFQAMRLAVEEINNSSHLLPNVTLGYHIWDTCEESLYLQAVLQLDPDGEHNSRAGYSDRVVAVVGPDTTDMTHLLSRILTFYQFLQISYNAKDQIFTDKRQFPLLFRMVPNENHQTRGLLSLVQQLGWKWVSAVGHGTQASQTSLQMLISEARAQGICVSYQGLLANRDWTLVSREQLKKVIENIERTKTNVTLLLVDNSVAQSFFRVVVELKVTRKIWIAPETWVLSEEVSNLPGIETVGTILGLTIKPVILPEFLPFVKKTLRCNPWNGLSPSEQQALKNVGGCYQFCSDCHSLSLEILEDVLNSRIWHWSFYSYAAIYALAQALHQLLGCDHESCPTKEVLTPWQLYEILAQVDFSLQNNTIKFSNQTDLFLGYNVITWNWVNGSLDHKTIGNYSAQSLIIDQSKIKWPTPDGLCFIINPPGSNPPAIAETGDLNPVLQAPSQSLYLFTTCTVKRSCWWVSGRQEVPPAAWSTSASGMPKTSPFEQLSWWQQQQNPPLDSLFLPEVPTSTCVTECKAGQIRSKHTLDECTCRCDSCPEGTYQNQTNSDFCLPCPPQMWSPKRSSTCFYPVITFLSIRDTTVAALIIVSLVDFSLLCGCLLVFALHRQTPVVRAAGGKLAFVMLVSLLASCTTTLLFVVEPTPLGCLVRQPIFALSFTLCISCLLVRSCQIVFIFKLARRLPWAHKLWLKYQGAYASLGLSVLLQGGLCALWLSLSPPSLQADVVSPREIFLRCSEGHVLGLGSVLGFLGLLGAACFALAFWGRNLPKNYSEARLLALSMLVFLMGWGSFMLIYATTEGKGRQIATLQMFTVQTSVYAILCTFFLPKCYIILFKPQHNTVAHFQTCIQTYTATPQTMTP